MRTFADFYGTVGEPAFSFEVFPPKTVKGMNNLSNVLRELVALRPNFMTVTYGAMGTTRERTLEIAARIKGDYDFETACHLTCVGASREELDRSLKRIRDAGIRNIVALRGDPPMGEKEFVAPEDGFAHANELVRHIRAFESRDGRGRIGVAVAGYPEKHVEAPDLDTDLRNLKRKVDTGADVVMTQLFLDNAHYFSFVEKARAIGIAVPIVPGMLPILSVKQIRKITSMCGVKIPDPLQAELEEAGDDDARARDIGIRQCVKQARELIERGAPGIHFYVLNKSSHMARIMQELRA
jgi:methylenetetrahydrofolate reductase (NADPH)